jgi:predicted small secreted protein
MNVIRRARAPSDAERRGTHIFLVITMRRYFMTNAMRIDGAYIRAAFTGLLLAGAVLGLSACNTVHGAGKDISNAGTATSNTATQVQQKL